ncbi:MmcB family DNA repair protein [Kordiimonas sp. SCSIO 12603]|uniref:MmcB family DNA repair protein n=1 Tax=Kordiimonas sp. SCSIO 12603 TaxID=2829596 RepID=UPI0021030ECA|nr:MmcB family DNA repair protein [Kordiimonas sp. SCSIO 12603]UTW58664.1 MmcB family DNA repair protein [Kordiimonas sp. SCSIO 12603]
MTETANITLGAERLLVELGYAPVREVVLKNNRRVDILGLNKRGGLVVVEVKSGLSDFRSDTKWQEYLDYCEEFYFAVDQHFPIGVFNESTSLPDITGIIIADAYGGEVLREAASRKVNAARAKKLIQQMARTAAMRLFEKAVG